jgi:hypothetical protein
MAESVAPQEGLGGIGDQSGAAQALPGAPLGQPQGRDHDQGGDREGDAHRRLFGFGAAEEVPAGFDHHVGGQREEGDGNEAQRSPFPLLAHTGQLPDDDHRCEDLDEGVETKADQGDGTGHHPGGDRHRRLDHVPGDGHVLGAKAPASQIRGPNVHLRLWLATPSTAAVVHGLTAVNFMLTTLPRTGARSSWWTAGENSGRGQRAMPSSSAATRG